MRQHPEVFDRLTAGNARHVSSTPEARPPAAEQRAALAAGQAPYAVLLSCADSRVVPEHIFDAGAGELFVVRVAGNVANTSAIASIEYAVANLGAGVIVVLGHQGCGAVTAAMQSVGGVDHGDNLNHLLAHIKATGDGAPVDDVVRKNATQVVEDLVERSAIIRDAVNEKRLELAAAYYEISSGEVTFLC